MPRAQQPDLAVVDVDHALGADGANHRRRGGALAGGENSGDLVRPLDVGHARGLQTGPEDLAVIDTADLPEDPVRVHVLVVEQHHVEPVRAPVEEIRAVHLEALEGADGALADKVAGLGEVRPEAALVAEGQGHPGGLAGLVDADRLAIGRRHRLLGIDQPRRHRRLQAGQDGLGMQSRPQAHRHHVEALLGQHLAVVGVDTLDAMLCRDPLGRRAMAVSHRHKPRPG